VISSGDVVGRISAAELVPSDEIEVVMETVSEEVSEIMEVVCVGTSDDVADDTSEVEETSKIDELASEVDGLTAEVDELISEVDKVVSDVEGDDSSEVMDEAASKEVEGSSKVVIEETSVEELVFSTEEIDKLSKLDRAVVSGFEVVEEMSVNDSVIEGLGDGSTVGCSEFSTDEDVRVSVIVVLSVKDEVAVLETVEPSVDRAVELSISENELSVDKNVTVSADDTEDDIVSVVSTESVFDEANSGSSILDSEITVLNVEATEIMVIVINVVAGLVAVDKTSVLEELSVYNDEDVMLSV
jgi:outer membrane murein-binding lipoprotein Lpp